MNPVPHASDPPEAAVAASVRWRSIAVLTASLTLGGAAIGMVGPLITVILERKGLSATLIGLNGAVPAIGLLSLVFGLPRLVRRVGAARAMYVGLALWAAALLLMPVFSGPGAWLVLRFFLSLGFCIHWVVGEAWVNAAATERNRGRVVGVYVTLYTLGSAVGPIVLSATGFSGLLPFVVVAVLIASAAVPLSLLPRAAGPEMPRGSESLAIAARTAPVAMAIGYIAGFCDIGIIALLPIYGVKGGQSVGTTMALLVAFLAGTAVTQLPLGWLAERKDRRVLIVACALVVIAAAALLPHALGSTPGMLLVMFLWGGAEIGFYTLGLVELGSKFARKQLIGANTVFALMYGIGAFTGPLTGGAAMDAWGTDGLPATIAAAAAVLVLLAVCDGIFGRKPQFDSNGSQSPGAR